MGRFCRQWLLKIQICCQESVYLSEYSIKFIRWICNNADHHNNYRITDDKVKGKSKLIFSEIIETSVGKYSVFVCPFDNRTENVLGVSVLFCMP